MNEILFSHTKFQSTLHERHAPIVKLLQNRNCHFIGVPMHLNIGDHLIMHGSLEFFRLHNIKITKFATIQSYRNNNIKNSDMLIFAGGGNFGDLYPATHEMRNKLILEATKQGCPVLILPQSIWFSNKEKILNNTNLFKSNKNIFLFTRDIQPFRIAQTILYPQNAFLAPDMAHYLYPKISEFTKNIIPTKEHLYLSRTDIETTPISDALTTNQNTYDWIDILKAIHSHNKLKSLIKLCHFFDKHLGIDLTNATFPIWSEKSWEIIKAVACFMANYKTIHTNRLHAVIFSLLLDRKYITSNSLYPKIKNYLDCWITHS